MKSYIQQPVNYLQKVRDLTVMTINPHQYLVIACDSDGGIGSKPLDTVQVPNSLLATFAVRVPLFELIACGAEPFLVVDCLSVEYEDTGKEIIDTIKSYSRKAGLTQDVQFTGSTEENVPTLQTGIGITVLGLADQDKFYPGKSKRRDVVVCAGIPKSAPEFELTIDDPDLLSIEDLILLRKHPEVGDMIPVGSKGLHFEANQLADSASLLFIPNKDSAIDLLRSGGPSSCVLLTIGREHVSTLSAVISAPLFIIGELQ